MEEGSIELGSGVKASDTFAWPNFIARDNRSG
jgi:hypothetical protein